MIMSSSYLSVLARKPHLSGDAVVIWLGFVSCVTKANRVHDLLHLSPELGAQQAIHNHVDGRVNDQQKVGHIQQDQRPHPEFVSASFVAVAGQMHSGQLSNVQQNPRCMAYQKDQNDGHEYYCKIVLGTPP